LNRYQYCTQPTADLTMGTGGSFLLPSYPGVIPQLVLQHSPISATFSDEELVGIAAEEVCPFSIYSTHEK